MRVIESITDEGRDELNKNCRLTTDQAGELLIHARTRVPWVQANLILTEHDQRTKIRAWQDHLKAHGVWVERTSSHFPFPGTPDYLKMWGIPDSSRLGARPSVLPQHISRQRI